MRNAEGLERVACESAHGTESSGSEAASEEIKEGKVTCAPEIYSQGRADWLDDYDRALALELWYCESLYDVQYLEDMGSMHE